jgi:hypothetical protein
VADGLVLELTTASINGTVWEDTSGLGNDGTIYGAKAGIIPKLELGGTFVQGVGGFIRDDGTFTLERVAAPSTVGSYAYNIYCVTDENSVLNQTVNVIVDGIKLNRTVVDLENEKIYIQALCADDDAAIPNANITYAGMYALTNSTGWAVFDTSSLPSVAYNATCYGVSEPSYGLTYRYANQTVAFEKEPVDPFTVKAEAPIANATWSDIERKLSFDSYGTIKVDVGDYGQPLQVEVNGAVWTDWSYDEAKRRVTIYNVASRVVLVWETAPEGVAPAPGVISPTSAPPAQPYVPTLPPPSPMPESALVNFGIVTIILVVGGAFIYKELESREKTTAKWRERQAQAKETVKWKARAKRKVKWRKRGRFD